MNWTLALGSLALAGLTAATASAEAASTDANLPHAIKHELRFEEVFRDTGEPATVHYRASYASQGAAHRLEVWRDGSRRLVRRTDDAIETHVAHEPGGPAYRMVVLDLHRKIETSVSRDDMYRIGNFTEWFDLAHGLRHPKSSYHLTEMKAPAGAPKSIAPCRWYLLEQGGNRTEVCWNARERLPMLVLDHRARVVWQVTAVSHAAASPTIFEIHDQGFVRDDAGQDISGD